ncbi:MAG: hypothetical protein ACIAXF_16930 [Phycisphaerales bacterium JB063]
MQAVHHSTKRIAIAAGVIATLVVVYVLSQLMTANAQTQRADSLRDVPGGASVDPTHKVEHARKITFHAWTDPDTGERYILAHGEADAHSLELLASSPRYTARYDSAFDPDKAEQRAAQWYATHGVGPGGWPSTFDSHGCYVFGRTTAGHPFRMVFSRSSGDFVMRYGLP